jgi:hypothetical protein
MTFAALPSVLSGSRPSRGPTPSSPGRTPRAARGVLLCGLTALLAGVVGCKGGGGTGDATRVKVFFEDGGVAKEFGDRGGLTTEMRFGVVKFNPARPDGPYTKLTYDMHGRTNSTVLRIGGQERQFGKFGGKWEKFGEVDDGRGGKRKSPALVGRNKDGGEKVECIWAFTEGIQVTQVVEVVPGESVMVGNKPKRLLDTVRVRYLLENKGAQAHRVGLRFLLDTLIGKNDGVPFIVPGLPGLVSTFMDFRTADKVPPFIEVLEVPNLQAPGVMARVNFKLGGKVEAPDRVSLTAWSRVQPWEIPVRHMGTDSAVVMYWSERELGPGATREVGFAYGLGGVTSKKGGLGVTVGGDFTPGGELTVVGLVKTPQPGEKLTLKLPEGFTLAKGVEATQMVPPVKDAGQPVPVTWRVVSPMRGGRHELEVQSSTGDTQTASVTLLGE